MLYLKNSSLHQFTLYQLNNLASLLSLTNKSQKNSKRGRRTKKQRKHNIIPNPKKVYLFSLFELFTIYKTILKILLENPFRKSFHRILSDNPYFQACSGFKKLQYPISNHFPTVETKMTEKNITIKLGRISDPDSLLDYC